MEFTTLHIKNMVCNRCIKVVKEEFEKMHLDVSEIELGKVIVMSKLSDEETEQVKSVLRNNGFELMDDRKSKLVDGIKTLIIEDVHHSQEGLRSGNSSDYIAEKMGYDYSYLSHLFSSVEGITIEKYMIHQKIEKVKELLVYNELTLLEISYQLGYSSVQHLSSQFKKVTGLTPTYYKNLKEKNRKPLDEV